MFSLLIQRFKRYPSFFIVGVIGFGANLLITYLLTEAIGLWYLFSTVIGAWISWTLVFVLNALFTFHSSLKDNLARKYLKNILSYLLLSPLGFGLIYLFTSVWGFYYLWSVVLVVGGMSLLSFAIHKRFVFDYKETQ